MYIEKHRGKHSIKEQDCESNDGETETEKRFSRYDCESYMKWILCRYEMRLGLCKRGRKNTLVI